MKRRDIKLLKKYAYFYSFTGNFPYIHRKGKFLLVAYYIIGIIYYSKVSTDYMKCSNVSEIGMVISTGIILLSIGSSIVCLRDVFFQKSLWDDFFTDVKTFDLIEKNRKCTSNETLFKYYIKIIMFSIAFIVSTIVVAFLSFLFVFIINYEKVIATTFHIFAYLQLTVTTISIEKILAIVEKRFDMFKRKLRETYLFWNPNKDFRNGQQLATSYLLLMNIIRKLNKLFGQKLLIILGLTFLFVLHCFHSISGKNLYWNDLRFDQLTNICVSMLILLVSIFVYFLIYLQHPTA